MLYPLSSISNRDCTLLHYYRILRQPSDFLNPIYSDSVPSVYEIQNGISSDVLEGEKLWEFHLGPIDNTKVPYLEFESDSEITRKAIESFVYLDTEKGSIFSKLPELPSPMQVKMYLVDSIDTISLMLSDYANAINDLKSRLGKLKELFEDKASDNPALAAISGRNQNLVQFTRVDSELTLEDSGYRVGSALEGQQFVNPTQELLSLLPKVLKHNINIIITDGGYRILEDFSGYTIFISGNGSWLFRDCKSVLNIFSAEGTADIKAMNCGLLYLRSNRILSNDLQTLDIKSLFLSSTSVIQFQGRVRRLYMVNRALFSMVGGKVDYLEYLGAACIYTCLAKNPIVNLGKILGELYLDGNDGGNRNLGLGVDYQMYLGGCRVGFNYNQHDFELPPSEFSSIDSGFVHIQNDQGGESDV